MAKRARIKDSMEWTVALDAVNLNLTGIRGKIRARRVTGVSVQEQRKISYLFYKEAVFL